MTSNTDDFLEKNVRDEMLVSAYKLALNRVIGSCVVIYLVTAVMWSHINHQFLISWASLMTISILIGSYNAKAFFRWFNGQEITKNWKVRFTLIPAITGLIWAVAVFVFYNYGAVEQKIFIITVVISISVLGVVFGYYFLPCYYVYVTPVFSSLAINFILEGTFTNIVLAILMVWALIFLLFFSKKLNATVFSELKLRHESHQLSNELTIRTKELEQANIAKSKFLAAASHDLRQPLHALSLFIDALKGSESAQERKSIFPRIDLSLEALRKLFDALLDISRLDANVVEPKVIDFDLSELLNSLTSEFNSDANEKKLKLKEHGKNIIVKSDPLLMERILRNLITNAIRYTESGGILLSARIRKDKILLQVWDTGIGIPQESKDKIFVEFQQLHNAHRDRVQGLGLGLAIVKRLCALLEHPLELRSKQDKGTVFNILMPIGDADLMISADADKITHSWDLAGHCIVVIDDERDILHAMDTLLSRWGCKVIVAESLQDAIDGLNKNKLSPDLILSDLRLKDDVTGIEVINSLRNQFGLNIEGILITGETSPEQIKVAKESGYKVLQKPVKPIRLRAVINHYLLCSKS